MINYTTLLDWSELNMSINVTVIVQKEDDWYITKCLENNVASQGKSIEAALSNLKEALELYYEDETPAPIFSQTFITTMEVTV